MVPEPSPFIVSFDSIGIIAAKAPPAINVDIAPATAVLISKDFPFSIVKPKYNS
jgi:hypothetical protein